MAVYKEGKTSLCHLWLLFILYCLRITGILIGLVVVDLRNSAQISGLCIGELGRNILMRTKMFFSITDTELMMNLVQIEIRRPDTLTAREQIFYRPRYFPSFEEFVEETQKGIEVTLKGINRKIYFTKKNNESISRTLY
jgi:hypothetical protein